MPSAERRVTHAVEFDFHGGGFMRHIWNGTGAWVVDVHPLGHGTVHSYTVSKSSLHDPMTSQHQRNPEPTGFIVADY